MMNELIVDNFAGGGGASTGIEQAIGRSVDIAINHDGDALLVHQANHPDTQHYISDVFEVDPREVTKGQPVGLAWFSPDCKHFSKAKGGAPVSKRVRGLAWVVIRWAATVKPRVIILENVEEFQTWGPVVATESGKHVPCPNRKGQTFNNWKRALEKQGYNVEMRELRACDYGAPTIRKRLFVVARCDGLPIIWPAPTHGKSESEEVISGKLKPWRIAAECIDWSIPCPSIFERKRPLAENTQRRIAEGLRRFVLESPSPFIISYYGAKKENDFRGLKLTDPLPTQTTENRFGLVTPTFVPFAVGCGGPKYSAKPRSVGKPELTLPASGNYRSLVVPSIVPIAHYNGSKIAHTCDEPLRTVTAFPKGGSFALVSAFLAKHYTGVVGQALEKPAGTVTTIDHHSLVTSNLVKMRNGCIGQSIDEPMHTITAGGIHFAEVRAFLIKYYGQGNGQGLDESLHTITTNDRFGLVTVDINGEPWAIADIGLRMLQPHELAAAQGFPDDYQLAEIDGKKMTKKLQVKLIGNSVCPPIAKALVEANYAEIKQQSQVV